MRYQRVITFLAAITPLASGFLTFDVNRQLRLLIHNQVNLSHVKEKWIDQPLDHFNPNETRTLRMRYFENLELWRPGGPVYIYIGGESEASWFSTADNDNWLISQMANETHGALYATEHRYYGESLPNITKDNVIEYYKYLSTQQALSDLANFITMLKSNPKLNQSKVVVVGGSYAGNLATWLRGQRPDLVDAALASSAPLLAKKDFHEAFDVARYTFDKYGTQGCLKKLEDSFKMIAEALKSASGINTLKQTHNICRDDDLTVYENQQLLFYIVYDDLLTLMQYGTPEHIVAICNNPQDYLFRTIEILEDEYCLRVDFDIYSKDKLTKAWISHSCNEFGYLITTSSEKQPFVRWNPLEFILKFCKNVIKGDIESKVDEGVARTNRKFGGRSPHVSKVVFTNGDMDLWSALGVLLGSGPDAPAFVINGTSHCADLYVTPGEPKQLTQTRETVKQIVKGWISTPLTFN